jgi:carbon storage regulator
MLVLSRKIGQSIEIGDSIKVVVSTIKGNRVQIAIVAPREIVIRRGELVSDTNPVALVEPVPVSPGDPLLNSAC